MKLPLRFAADPTYATWPGGQRTVYTSPARSNGQVGYTFEFGPELAGGTFELGGVRGATGREDLDIQFYASLSPTVATGGFQQRARGGESGPIPKGSRYAVVTMFEGLDAQFKFVGEPGDGSGEEVPSVPPPGIHADWGKAGNEELASKLRDTSQVVIALVDTGINPYHVAFRRTENVVHPSRYIEGFPQDVPALGLTLGEKDYLKARGADDADVWSQVGGRNLYWIPGTNVIGAYSVRDVVDAPPTGVKPRPIIDDHLHGTGVASVAAGRGFSLQTKAPYGSNPDALIVVVEGFGTEAVKWASSQPWIDFISGSYGDPAAVPMNDSVPDSTPAEPLLYREYRHTGPFVLRDGRTACFSAGNGLTRTGVAADRYSSLRPTSGPSWVVTVGAVSPRNRQDYGWHSVPVDVSSFGNHWPAAAPYSTDGEQTFSGTSNATPVTCGVFSRALQAARSAMGDTREGVHVKKGQRVPAAGDKVRNGALGKKGPLADGLLTRAELQEAVLKTARPTEFNAETWPYDPVVVPDTPAYYTQQGYGIADRQSAERAIAGLLGAPLPDRSDVDAWIAKVDTVRDAVYPPSRHGGAAGDGKTSSRRDARRR